MDIRKYLNRHSDIFEAADITPNIIPFSDAVVAACRANRCGKYGTCWTCPPGVGELNDLKSKICSFEKGVVFTCKYELEDTFDFEGMTEGASKTADILYKITDELRKDNLNFLALGCEGCRLCQECTYPEAPCRFPDKATPSIEACGISVIELAQKIGVNYNNGPNTVTYFCMILY